MESAKLLFIMLISCISIAAQDGKKGCNKEMKKESEADCMKWIDLLGASKEYNPDSITFRSFLYCARVLNEECNAILNYEDLNKDNLVKVIVTYNGVDYSVNTYKNEASTELHYDDGDDDDDDDDDDDSDDDDSPQEKSNTHSS